MIDRSKKIITSLKEKNASLINELDLEKSKLLIARRQIDNLQSDLNKVLNTKKWKTIHSLDNLFPPNIKSILILPLSIIWEVLKMLKDRYVRFRNIQYIRQSGLFEDQWYLNTYQDVANAKMNPVEHYLDFGAYEHRNPGPNFNSEIYLLQNPDVVAAKMNPLVHFARFKLKPLPGLGITQSKNPILRIVLRYMTFYERKFIYIYKYTAYIFSLLKFYVHNNGKKIVVIFTHDNFLLSVGGVEKYIYNEILQLNKNSINAISIYPSAVGQPSRFTILFNHIIFLTDVDSQMLMQLLKFFVKTNSLISYNVHHLLYYQIQDIKLILSTISTKKIILYLHDIFFINTKLFFSLNPHLNTSMYYSEDIQNMDLIPMFTKLIKNATYIIAPSNFLKKRLIQEFGDIVSKKKLIIENHLLFDTYKKKILHRNEKLKIAFLGYQTNFKGYNVFNSLAESLLIRNKYLFYSFGNNPKNNRFNNIINIDLGFKREIDTQITTILLNNSIDIVILWSLLPESYSYTLHEAYSAGIPVITNTISGNIYESVANGTIYGKAFVSDYELLQFLSDEYKVLNFINKNKPIIRIMRHNSAFIKLTSSNNL